MADFLTKSWLLCNYHVSPGATTRLVDILSHLQQSLGNTHNIQYKDKTVSCFIRDLWGEHITVNRKVISGTYPLRQRTTLYTNLSIKDTTQPSESDGMSWETLKSFCPSGWSPPHLNSDGILVWVKISTTTNTVNGCRIVTEVQMKREESGLTVAVKYGSRTVNLEDIGFKVSEFFCHNGSSVHQINALMDMISNTSFCSGFEWTRSTVTSQGHSEKWKISDREITKMRSNSCELFCRLSTCCSKCLLLKRKMNARVCASDEDNNSRHKKLKMMDKAEVIELLKKEQKLRRNAELREKGLRRKLQEEMLEFDSNDDRDFTEMFQLIDEKQLGDDMKILFQQQKDILRQKNAKEYRWHPRIIQLCLSIYARSPQVYDELAKVLILPSKRTIRYNKNKNPQEPGWNYESVKGLLDAANKKGLKEVDRWGGLCFDEMAIQEDLQLLKCGGKSKLVGIVSLGNSFTDMQRLMKGDWKAETATHVLQFVFIGDGGLRYPIAHFPTRECPPATLYRIFWEGVQLLLKAGFHVYWSCCDGGESNRGFINLHFKDKSARESNFTTRNPMTGGKMIFIMDPKHNIKKIRNNLEKSTETGKTTLQLNGNKVAVEVLVRCIYYRSNFQPSSYT
ncbi:uncharacterized protein [Ptychodera flava]|uniref:uncharacterized protein n=1 Tax=Ptychodera flava TaxID=63121 RepID=UPI00396A5CC0